MSISPESSNCIIQAILGSLHFHIIVTHILVYIKMVPCGSLEVKWLFYASELQAPIPEVKRSVHHR